jgi:hypothetical protein
LVGSESRYVGGESIRFVQALQRLYSAHGEIRAPDYPAVSVTKSDEVESWIVNLGSQADTAESQFWVSLFRRGHPDAFWSASFLHSVDIDDLVRFLKFYLPAKSMFLYEPSRSSTPEESREMVFRKAESLAPNQVLVFSNHGDFSLPASLILSTNWGALTRYELARYLKSGRDVSVPFYPNIEAIRIHCLAGDILFEAPCGFLNVNPRLTVLSAGSAIDLVVNLVDHFGGRLIVPRQLKKVVAELIG